MSAATGRSILQISEYFDRAPVSYILSALAAELCFDATDYRISFIGHSHVALWFSRDAAGGTVSRATIQVR